MEQAERIELKGVICRIAHILFEIDTKMQPSLKERVDHLRESEYTDQDLRDLYDQYIEEIAEEYVERIEQSEKK